MSSLPGWWIIARASGVGAYLALSGSVIAGLMLRSRLAQRATTPLERIEWHRVLAMLAFVLVGIHGLALVMDTYVTTTVVDLLIGVTATYRPAWTTLGVLGLWVMVLVSLTAMMRTRLPARVWKRIHLASYLAYALVTAHGVLAGADTPRAWMLGIYLTSGAVVVGLLTRRLIAPPNPPERRRRAIPD